MWQAFLGGIIGGFLRGIVGFLKKVRLKGKAKFDLNYFLLTLLLGGIVGFFTIFIARDFGKALFKVNLTFGVAILLGYAGGDFLEALYKIFLKKFIKK